MEDTEQNRAIRINNNGNLLVSASAGAGKTKVLVDRLIHQLTPKSEVFNQLQRALGIDNFLIVTFTRAAAKEMKQRIHKKLREAVNASDLQRDKSAFLRQIGDLPTANIGTLDSFCGQVVRHYYYIIGLDPHFRILKDDTEKILLRDLVWKSVRESLYADKNNEAFRGLALKFFRRHINSDDQLTDPLTNLVFSLYDSFKQYVYISKSNHKSENPQINLKINLNYDKLFESWSNHITKIYRIGKSLKQSELYKHLFNELNIKLSQILNEYKAALKLIKKHHLDLEYKAIVPEYQEIQHVQTLSNPDNKCSWDELRQVAKNVTKIYGHKFPSKKDSKNKQVHAIVLKKRSNAKKNYKKLVSNFFIFDEKKNDSIIKKSYVTIKELLNVVKEFDKKYTQVKKQRHELEYVDIERLALKILETSKAVREHYQNQFHEIMIDEYQDDNQLQDTILKLVAKPNQNNSDTTNIFMVGDVKQSIYRFRLADPKLFKHKYNTYPKSEDNQLVKLTRNYRSTKNIDRFVNLIFSQVMDDDLGGVPYSTEPEVFGAKDKYSTDSVNNTPVNIMIYDGLSKSKEYDQLFTKDKIRDNTYGQIEMVAQQIKSLVDNPNSKVVIKNDKAQKNNKLPKFTARHLKYKDIALIASTRNDNVAISDIFRKYNIPVQMLGSQNYFRATEIQIMLSLLEIIDNPYQDIPLVAVLRSPMVGLDENQLAYLRINSNTGDYYHALKKFYDNYPSNGYPNSKTGDEIHRSINQFFHNLNKFRKITQRHGLVDLIWSIYQTTGYLDYVGGMPGGVQRQANLHALYERAAQYEQSNFHGLFQFIQFIHQLQNQKKDLTDAVPQQGGNVVTSVTIHNSKGREFPIVFLLDTTHGFNTRSLKRDYILSNDLGLGMKYFDTNLHSESSTLPYQCIVDYEKQENKSEEMRKLYVALTRTQQHLYIVGMTTKKPSKRGKESNPQKILVHGWEQSEIDSNPVLDLTNRMGAKDYLDWIGTTIIRQPLFRKENVDYLKKNRQLVYQGLKDDDTRIKLNFYDKITIVNNRNKFNLGSSIQLDPNLLNQNEKQYIKDVMFKQYRYQAATHEGNYRSVSDVKQLFADPNDIEMGKLDQEYHHDYHGLSNQYVTGDFAEPKFIQNSSNPKATDVGTATHLVLQMVKLNHIKSISRSIDDTISKLIRYKMIDKDIAKCINRKDIKSFFDSWYGKKVLNCSRYHYYRETPFSLLLKTSEILPKEFKNDPQSFLIHGIIDGYLYDKRNKDVYLVDYKTDYVNTYNQQTIQDSINNIKRRYEGQLNLYSKALKSVYGEHNLKFKGLYLLSIKKLVPVGDASVKLDEYEKSKD